MANEMPAVGTRAVHKDDHAKTQGPVWQVTGQNPETKDVNLAHAPNAKLNEGRKPEFRHVPIPEFHKDYVQL